APTATYIYTLSLHDALPIFHLIVQQTRFSDGARRVQSIAEVIGIDESGEVELRHIYDFHPTEKEFLPTGYIPSFIDKLIDANLLDRKSTRLNSSHVKISYAV